MYPNDSKRVTLNHMVVYVLFLSPLLFSRTENKISQNRKVTDYYPIRRSSRKTKAEMKVGMKVAVLLGENKTP